MYFSNCNINFIKICFMLYFLSRLIFLLLAFSPLFSCISRIEKRGYMFDLYQPNSLQKKISSQRTVLENLGSPTIAITIDNKQHFMYLSEDVRHLLFFKPKVIERNILLINFDDNNYIADISSYNLANENSDFKFSSQTTAIKRKNNLVDHFINNTSKLGS